LTAADTTAPGPGPDERLGRHHRAAGVLHGLVEFESVSEAAA